MSVGLMPVGNDAPFIDANGDPLSGGLLYFYVAGSSTPQNTYTTSAGSVANANPIVLGSGGYPSSSGNVVQIWGTDGVSYKAILKTSAGVTVWTRDNLEVINDANVTIDQWVTGPTPTYISATSFSLVGDQTANFQVSRRIKTTNTAGTVYSTITASTFGAVTTVTVASDPTSALDSGLSAVSYGLISATNPSIDADMINRKGTAVASAATCNIWGIAGNYVHISGTTGISSFGTAPFAGAVRRIIHDGAVTLTNGTNLKCPGDQDLAVAANDMYEVVADTTTAFRVVSVTKAFSRPAQFPPMHVQGLTWANNVADATNDIDVAVGSCRDATDAMDMILATALTKQTDVAWAVGSGNGGLDTGAVGNNPYFIWLIKRSDTGVVDALFSLSSTAPTVPANYDYKKLIGYLLRAGGAILAFKTYELTGGGVEYQWAAPRLDVDLSNTLTTSRRTDALSVPLSFTTIAYVRALWADATTGSSNVLCNPDETDAAPSTTASPGLVALNSAATTTVVSGRVRTSATGTVASRSTLATVDTYRIFTVGFEWARRN